VPNVLGTTRAPRDLSTMGVLREHTASAHERLEERLAEFGWLATRESYTAMIERLYGFYVRAEPALVARGSSIPGLDLEQRRKAPLLVADLTALGRSPRELRALPRVDRVPRLDEPARVLGVLYVIEGATLGGKLIEREVAVRLGLDRRTGTAFFGAYGADVAHQWRRLGGVVEREAPELDVVVMCAAAADTFDTLDRWLVT
jgi:heme oxygenase (biliverdin-IX-beta and delta-forming)